MKQALKTTYVSYIKPYKKYIISTVLFAIVVLMLTGGADEAVVEESEGAVLVKVATPAELSGGNSTELIGTVAAKTQADLQTEVGGRVTSVAVSLGARVSAGQIIATIENASEQASVLQAQGAYEGALASAAQSGVSVDEAQNNLTAAQNSVITNYKSAYNTSNTILTSTIDTYFASPLTTVPGLRLNGRGYTTFLNDERVKLQTTMATWREQSIALDASDANPELLNGAANNTRTILAMVDAFIEILQNQGAEGRYTDAEIQNALASFSAARSTLTGTLSALDSAATNLVAATEAQKRAVLGGGAPNSAAEAQVKQALGSLRAAQANLAKTIIRTPIAGEVNTLSVKAGDFVGSFAPVAKIANNQGLEVTTFIGSTERDLLAIGDELIVEGAGTGTVTNISPAIDAATGKIEVRVGVTASTLQNGDSVRLFIQEKTSATTAAILVPLAAIKFDGSDAYVFRVIDNKLARFDIELGAIRGDSVVIISGIEATTQIVSDARGQVEGTEVTVVAK